MRLEIRTIVNRTLSSIPSTQLNPKKTDLQKKNPETQYGIENPDLGAKPKFGTIGQIILKAPKT